MNATAISVVVVIHDSVAELGRLLPSMPPAVELIVVDSGSRDGGGRVAAAAGARVVTLDGNAGFGPACNAGLGFATAPVTVLLNPDTELRGDALERLADIVRRQDVLAAPRLVHDDGTVQDSAHPLPGSLDTVLAALMPYALLPAPVRLHVTPWRTRGGPRRVGWAIAACMAARTNTLRALGPFDPAAFLYYEDLDLCLRARSRGIPTLYAPGIVVHHSSAHATTRAFGGTPYELLARRRREVVRERLGARRLTVDDAAEALTFITRIAGRTLLGRSADAPRARLRALRAARRARPRTD